MSKYELVIWWSEEDQAYLVEVPELPGCMADGKTYEEAIANVQVIITEWIETARELGTAVPEPRGRPMYASRPTLPGAARTASTSPKTPRPR